MSVKTYNMKEMTVIFGNVIISGYAPGNSIKVTMNTDLYNQQIGADGEGARARINDDSATVEITLMQTSASNDELSAIAILDKNTGDGVFPLLLKDPNGNTVYSTNCAYISKLPDSEFGTEITSRTWILMTPKMDVAFIGGN